MSEKPTAVSVNEAPADLKPAKPDKPAKPAKETERRPSAVEGVDDLLGFLDSDNSGDDSGMGSMGGDDELLMSDELLGELLNF